MRDLLFVLLFSMLGCASTPPAATSNYFGDSEGCLLLYNVKSGVFEKTVHEGECRRQYPACSTFKVPLAVMAFDSGVLKNETVVLKWDGKKDERPEVNRDHDARTWMRDSVVWFSQHITPKLGQDRFQEYLDGFQYGNRDLKAGITEAWLVSPSSSGPALKVSAYEQVEFMKKLWSDSLPASKRAMQLARDITFLEVSPKGFRLHGKTGSNFYDPRHEVHFGWFIAHLEKEGAEFIAVANFHDLNPAPGREYGGRRAKRMLKTFLADQGLW